MAIELLVFLLLYIFGWALIFHLSMPEWSFVDAIYYVVVSSTTVGFGDYNFLGVGNGMRALFIIQSFSGFILLGVLGIRASLAKAKAETKYDFIVRAEGEENHPDDDDDIARARLKWQILYVLLYWAAGTIFYRYVEEEPMAITVPSAAAEEGRRAEEMMLSCI